MREATQAMMTRGELLLDAIYDDVDQRLNPSGDECPECGGEGYTYDCFDGCCVDAESGCGDCERRCMECARYKHARLKAIREEVIKSNDVEIAVAWLKSVGRWRNGITNEQVKAELADAASALARTESERDAIRPGASPEPASVAPRSSDAGSSGGGDV